VGGRISQKVAVGVVFVEVWLAVRTTAAVPEG
jgi:hypothetical protein